MAWHCKACLLSCSRHTSVCACRYDKAVTVLRHGLAVQPSARLHWMLGDTLYELSELDSAAAQYEAVACSTEAQPAERKHVLQQLVRTYRQQGDEEKAAQFGHEEDAERSTSESREQTVKA